MVSSLPREKNTSMERILNDLVYQQEQNIRQFNNVATALDSIKTDISRARENRAKELERLHSIVNSLLPLSSSLTAPTSPQRDCHEMKCRNNSSPSELMNKLHEEEEEAKLVEEHKPIQDPKPPSRAFAALKLSTTATRPNFHVSQLSATPCLGALVAGFDQHSIATHSYAGSNADSKEISYDSSDGEPWDVLTGEDEHSN